ncbi:sorbose reductase sou1 [Lentinus tigrinus ALCF2SS1-7]|uniref:Sorbose reductase sou1 n=1 Tax=Lentinus tigrinus ALCF2SS1-6 TaxID=1328759 RepID=A0A5C2RVW4_9APHY|nr:sorbose reductase sou1 [Lentinus tigrinus ALCF2SS1-6]RPD74111.1 sorbose reductase sou1 [Lentinus tigrinus ALCF2SS1-7]
MFSNITRISLSGSSRALTSLAKARPLLGAHRRLSTQAPLRHGAVGVARALSESSSSAKSPTLLTQEFGLSEKVALVTGANRGIGLEAALALSEAGARTVYCVDISKEPGEEWTKVQSFVSRTGLGKLEYMCGDVRDQEAMWQIGEKIGEREGRMDVCVTAAGIFIAGPSLEYSAKDFENVIAVNLNGTLFTAQAAGRQMVRFGNGGSVIMIASICGSIALEPTLSSVSYHSSKSGVLQMARSMACELGPQRIRVNTISPGFIKTKLIEFFEENPEMKSMYEHANPLGRIGRPDELRGVVAWLASDASSYCTGSDIIVDGGHRAW